MIFFICLPHFNFELKFWMKQANIALIQGKGSDLLHIPLKLSESNKGGKNKFLPRLFPNKRKLPTQD